MPSPSISSTRESSPTLTGLPAELRTQIFTYLVPNNPPPVLEIVPSRPGAFRRRATQWATLAALSRTCRNVSPEGQDLLYNHDHEFVIYVKKGFGAVTSSIMQLSDDLHFLARMRHVSLIANWVWTDNDIDHLTVLRFEEVLLKLRDSTQLQRLDVEIKLSPGPAGRNTQYVDGLNHKLEALKWEINKRLAEDSADAKDLMLEFGLNAATGLRGG